MNLFYLVAFVFALSGWGNYPYLKLIKKDRSHLERFLITQIAGFTLTWLFVFIVCALNILHVSWIHVWVLAGTVFYMLHWRKDVFNGCWWTDLFSQLKTKNEIVLTNLLSALIVTAYLIFLYFAHAPTTTWDPLDYHYVMPLEWLKNGGFINLPKLMYSNFPSSVELIWLSGFALRNDILANFMTWWFGVLLGLTITLIARNYFSTLAGWAGLALLISLPIIFTEEMPGGVIDLAVFSVNLLALYFAVNYVKDRNNEDFFISLLCASNGLAMKHSSALTLFFIAALFLYFGYKSGNLSRFFKLTAAYVTFAFLLPLPWYIKSFIYTGNPIFPFLNNFFNPSSQLSIDIMYWSNPSFTRGFFDWLTYWYHVTTDISLVQFRFRLINGVYLGMLPFIYWAIKKTGNHRIFIAYALFIIIMLLYEAPGEPRYQFAAWAIWGVALSYGLILSGILRDLVMRIIFPLVMIVPITIMMVMCVHENRNKHGFILGKDTRHQYYAKNIGIYSLIDHFNTETPDDSTIIWCDPRVLLFRKDYIPAYPFDTGTLPSWRNDAIDIVKEWKNMGVTHLGFTMAANYRAWVVGVLLEQAEIDGVNSGSVYIENSLAPGIKYEDGLKLDFEFSPMDRRVFKLGTLTPRSLQLASYATRGIEPFLKENTNMYRADIDILINERSADIDVLMIRKLIEIGNLRFLSPVKVDEYEGIVFELNYSPLEWLVSGGE